MNKIAGFWIRFFVRILDSMVVFVLTGIFLFFIIDINVKNESIEGFKSNILFYILILFFIFLLSMVFIVTPFFLKGQTLFMKLFKIKIEFKTKNILFSLIMRELFFSIGWMFMSLLVATIINHTFILKFASLNFNQSEFSYFEIFRIYIVRSFGAIILLIQFCFWISIIVREDKVGLHDLQSKTRVIWINKFVEKTKKIAITRILPQKIKNNPVIWINKKEKK